MEIEVQVVPSEPRQSIDATAVAIIDVLRATTTMVVALSAGANCIYPVTDIEEGRQLLAELHHNALLIGEEEGYRIPGFDMGNSPFEFTPQAVAGKTLIMRTTNGTRAIAAVRDSTETIFTAALVNLSAAVEYALEQQRLLIICSGSRGRFSLEDAYCAGGLVYEISQQKEVELSDGAITCVRLYEAHRDDPLKLLLTSHHGKHLKSLGFDKDLKYCATIDKYAEVPIWNGNYMVLKK